MVQSENRNDTNKAEISDLFRKIGQGEKKALFDLYDRTNKLLFGLTLKILGNPADAEETLLNIYTSIWKDPVPYNAHYPPLASLVIIARAHALIGLYETHLSYAPTQAAMTDAGETNIVSKEQEDARIHFETLAPIQREVLDWAFCSGLSSEEIAAKTDVPVNAVKTHVRVGLNRLSKAFEFPKPIPKPVKRHLVFTDETEGNAW